MPSQTAQRNHDQLFGGRVSTLAATDPQLIEYFDNFAFDEVLAHGDLEPRTRLMTQLAAMIACQAVSEYRTASRQTPAVGKLEPGMHEPQSTAGRQQHPGSEPASEVGWGGPEAER